LGAHAFGLQAMIRLFVLAIVRYSSITLLLAVLTSQWLGLSADAASMVWNDAFAHNREAMRQNMPLTRWRKHGFLNHLYQFDHKPLGQRTPVILVPGRAEEFQQNSWWKRFNRLAKKNDDFQKRYKLYAFIYASKNEVDVHAADFLEELHAYFGDFVAQGRTVKIVCYSLGGTITQEVLKDPNALSLVSSVQALAVSFHGSPMFNPEWFRRHLNPPNHSPIRQWWDKTIYHLYLFDKTNLTRGLAWDNFDGSQPLFGDITVQGHQLVSPVTPYHEPSTLRSFKDKLIVYTSYLDNNYTADRKQNTLIKAVINTPKLPETVVGSVLPYYGISVHSVFKYMNRQLANLPTYSAQHPAGEVKQLFRYNDGAFPLVSMLYLPPRSEEYDEDLQELTRFIDVKQARIFPNIDHMDMGEYVLRRTNIVVSDLMAPGDAAKTPSEWVISDLLTQPDESSPALKRLVGLPAENLP